MNFAFFKAVIEFDGFPTYGKMHSTLNETVRWVFAFVNVHLDCNLVKYRMLFGFYSFEMEFGSLK